MLFNYQNISMNLCYLKYLNNFVLSSIGYINQNGGMVIDLNKEIRWLKSDLIEEECKECTFLPICISNRCHYSGKIRKTRRCLEYKELIESQIICMITKHKYFDVRMKNDV